MKKRLWTILFLVVTAPMATAPGPADHLAIPTKIGKLGRLPKAAPTAIAGKAKGEITRRDFLKRITLGIGGLTVLTKARPLSQAVAAQAVPEEFTDQGPTDEQMVERDFRILVSLFQGPVNEYYQKIRRLASKVEDPIELEKLIETENDQLLAQLKKILDQNELGFLGSFSELHHYFLQRSFWFDKSLVSEIVQGRAVTNLLSFTMGKIGSAQKISKYWLESENFPLALPIEVDEVILNEILIRPYQEIESGQQAYAASWLWISENYQSVAVLYDLPLLLDSGRVLWHRLRSAKSPKVIRWKLNVLLAKKDYSALGLFLRLALRQAQWQDAVQSSDPDSFAQHYAEAMMGTLLWRELSQLVDPPSNEDLREAESVQDGLHEILSATKIRQILRQLVHGTIPYEILAQVADWAWGEPKGSILQDAADTLLGQGINRVIYKHWKEKGFSHLKLKLGHLNLDDDDKEDQEVAMYEVLATLPRLTREEIKRIAREILFGSDSLDKELSPDEALLLSL